LRKGKKKARVHTNTQWKEHNNSCPLCKVIGEERGLGYIPEMGMAGVGFRGGGRWWGWRQLNKLLKRTQTLVISLQSREPSECILVTEVNDLPLLFRPAGVQCTSSTRLCLSSQFFLVAWISPKSCKWILTIPFYLSL